MPPGADAKMPRGILLIEDDPGNALAMEAALEEIGEMVVTARSGGEALRILFEQDFALALLDVHMPGLDGLETARLIRARGRTRQLPIIFVTGDAESHRRMLDAYELGAVDFMVKPIVPVVLRAKARTLIELQRQAAQLAEKEHQRRLIQELAMRVAERDAMALELGRLNAELRQLDRRKDDFLAVLAHELRNPLTPISVGLDLLQLEPTPEKVAELTPMMQRQLRLALRLVEDLGDVARVRSGKLELRLARLDLRSVVEDALAASRAAIEQRHHRIVARIAEDALPIDGDRDRLAQVVLNLLSNAARYMDPGGEIEIDVQRSGSDAILVVSDSGRGIAEDALETIFDAYAQVDPAIGLGLGLGLHLVRHFVERHGGRVLARSDGVGRGSRFEVRIPLSVPGDGGDTPA